MLFVSTRGQVGKVSSAHAIKEGLAGDGGLFVPQTFPGLSLDTILGMHALSYEQMAVMILENFLTDYSVEELTECAGAAYSSVKFGADPAPLRNVGERTDVLELWHGPTMAFKDIALQILPHLMTKAQEKTGADTRIVILAATSGDTGKAALEGFADVPGTEIIVFYPEDGVSPVQKLQMVTQAGKNTKVFGIHGNFDDAQRGVKEIFGNAELEKELKDCGWVFSSANSINWGRLAPQITYYFKAYSDAVANERIKPGEKIIFSVPTGNFGDILAGYYAKKMGLPVKHFICASNSNNVLTDFINTGVYDKNRELNKTVSPSMDILVSSNLERLLFDLTENDAAQVADWMEQLNTTGKYQVSKDVLEQIRELFFAAWIDEQETVDAIGRVHNDFEYLIDPHTSVAWRAAEKYRLLSGDDSYIVVLSTASPFKFCKTVLEGIGKAAGLNETDPFEAAHRLAEETETAVPPQVLALESMPVLHKEVIAADEMAQHIKKTLEIAQ
ncbi:MAG TPA: threonine synthase [Acidaminococcaceae bacterium]|nr:threonine synthase [Acidaminococcaceae bacterium]